MPSSRRLDRVYLQATAGLQAGILAGAVMLGWMAAASWAQGQSPWTIPNLLAATFHGGRAYRPDFHWRTWSGLGLHFFCSGGLGVVFSLIRPAVRHPWITALVGLLFSLVLYAVVAPRFWEQVNGPLGAYSRQGFVLAGYSLFGALLASVDGFAAGDLQGLGGEERDGPAVDADGIA